MIDPSVAEIATALREVGFPPRFRDDEWRLLIRFLKYVAEGHPVSPRHIEQVATSIPMPLDAATSFLGQLSERDEEGNIVGVFGLSQRKHPHQFKVNDQTLSTWCAWDALFLPAMLGQTAAVESSCPATKAGIRVRITPAKVEEVQPPASVVTIAVPNVAGTGLESVETIWKTFCCFVHFFASKESAVEWISAKNQDLRILSVEQAHQLGQIVFQDSLKHVESQVWTCPMPIS